MNNKLPALYKSTKLNATQFCSITVSGDTFTVTWGQVNGKEQSKPTKCFTTNSGKANERTPEQQAQFEAQAKWQKKVDTGYTTHLPSDAPDDFAAINLPLLEEIINNDTTNNNQAN